MGRDKLRNYLDRRPTRAYLPFKLITGTGSGQVSRKHYLSENFVTVNKYLMT